MSSEEWKEYKLGDFADVQNGYAFKSSEFSAVGVPIIKIKNIVNSKINLDEAQYFNSEILAKLQPFVVCKNDILISMTGSHINQIASAVGKIGKYLLDYPALLNQRVGKIFVKNTKICDKVYLYYFLNRYETQFELASNAGGSANQANISPSQIKNLKLVLPVIPIQRRIASILSSLDDKIELNRQTNQTLEAIAQAIFKEWFVDFNFPGVSPFENELPVGWKKVPINDLTSNIQYGFTQSSSINEVGPKFLRITDIQGGTVDWDKVPFCIVTENEARKYEIKNHDIFIARTGASTGENIYIINPPKAVFASYLIRAQFDDPALACYVAKFLRTNEYFSYINSIMGGSAQPNANAKQLTNIEIVLPTKTELDVFFRIVDNLNQKINSNIKENQTLGELRDTLIPKLMKGEITINETEKLTAAAL